MEYLDELRDAIRRLHGVESEYVETVPVVEEFEGRTMWAVCRRVEDTAGGVTGDGGEGRHRSNAGSRAEPRIQSQ